MLRPKTLLFTTSCLLATLVSLAYADVRLPRVFADHMVLQRDVELPIWGWADPGEKITVKIGKHTVRTLADEDGRWLVNCPRMEAGGPHKITIKGKNTIHLKDVLFGEVWLCSGQSNMAFALRDAASAEEELPKATFPEIRLFNMRGSPIPYNVVFNEEQLARCTPQEYYDIDPWVECTPNSAAGFSAVAYFFGRDLHKTLNVPIGLIHNAISGSPIETWISRDALEAHPQLRRILDNWPNNDLVNPWCRARGRVNLSGLTTDEIASSSVRHPYEPAFLYDAGIAPLVPFVFRGVIWYQGESNTYDAVLYKKLFATLVDDWRHTWNQGDFPFLYVQLPNMNKYDWPRFREAQLECLTIPNTGMAVTIDIGDPTNIHPPNKRDVGNRLALIARAKVYGEDIIYSGPVVDSTQTQGRVLRIAFKHTGGGLRTRDGGEPALFELFGGHDEYGLGFTRIEGNEIIVASPYMESPVAVRYAWGPDPVCNLINAEGLPASPFRLALPGVNIEQVMSENQIRIVSMGDSITKGVRDGVTAYETYTTLLEGMLRMDGTNAEIINLGVEGERTDQALDRLDRDVLSLEPDIVTIMYGTNDSHIDSGTTEPRLSMEEYFENLRQIVKRFKSEGVRPILLTPPRMTDAYSVKSYEPYKSNDINFMLVKYALLCREVAIEEEVPLVDIFNLWFRQAALGQPLDAWLTDGCHPNTLGHQMIAETFYPLVYNEIAKILERRRNTVFPLNSKPQPRGYTIPTIDLAHETHRQIVVDREPGQYLGHPTTVLLEDNKTMIAVYPKGHGRGAIVMKRSADAGLTWSERLPVPENWSTSKEVPTIYRVTDKQGVRRLIMFSGLYPIRLAVSEDDGTTWSPLEPVGDWGGIVAMASVVELKNGDYMAMFHDDGRFFTADGQSTGVFTLYKTFSEDGGLTWSSPEEIFKSDQVHLCEPGVVRSPDGGQLAALLRENSRTRNSYVIFSNDEGQTWSEPHELPAALTGDRHTAKYAPDGRLLISFRDKAHDSPTYGDWAAWVGAYDDIVEGREGQYRVRLMDNKKDSDCAYPGVEMLPDGTFVLTTYGHWIEDQEPFIVSVRLTLEEIDEKARQLR